MSSGTSALAFLAHLLAFAVNGGGLLYDVLFISEKGEGALEYRGFPGKFKHLTFWDQILQTVFFGFSLLNDLFGSNLNPWDDLSKRSRLQRVRDAVVASVIFPMGSFVVIIFWGLYVVDRELVFPKHLDGIIPMWLNHVMHTTVIVFLLLEKSVVFHHYPRRWKGLLGSVFVGAIYQIWIFWIAYHANIWVYPVLQVLGVMGRVAFLAACWLTLIVLYLSGEWITNSIWVPHTVTTVKKEV